MAIQSAGRTPKLWDGRSVRDAARIREFTQRCAWEEGVHFTDANVHDGGLGLHVVRPDTVSYAPGSMASLPRTIRIEEIK